jgi:hypothetical protein
MANPRKEEFRATPWIFGNPFATAGGANHQEGKESRADGHASGNIALGRERQRSFKPLMFGTHAKLPPNRDEEILKAFVKPPFVSGQPTQSVRIYGEVDPLFLPATFRHPFRDRSRPVVR